MIKYIGIILPNKWKHNILVYMLITKWGKALKEWPSPSEQNIYSHYIYLYAATGAELRLHAALILGEEVRRHERLDAPGKAAAVHAPRALALEQAAAVLQPLGELGVARGAGDDVVEKLLGRAPGLVHQAHIRLPVAAL